MFLPVPKFSPLSGFFYAHFARNAFAVRDPPTARLGSLHAALRLTPKWWGWADVPSQTTANTAFVHGLRHRFSSNQEWVTDVSEFMSIYINKNSPPRQKLFAYTSDVVAETVGIVERISDEMDVAISRHLPDAVAKVRVTWHQSASICRRPWRHP